MALAANALTTVAEMATELGISAGSGSANETLLWRLIAVASEAIARHCDRVFQRGTVTEAVAGKGDQFLLLSRTPLVSITSITIDGTTLDSNGYAIHDAEAGIIRADSPFNWTAPWDDSAEARRIPGDEEKSYSVVYVGGYILPSAGGTRNLPYDLEQACIDTVVNLWRQRGRYRNLAEETQETDEDDWVGNVIPGQALRILQRYRRVV